MRPINELINKDEPAWPEVDLSYTQFVVWSLQGDIAKFYETLRWLGWEQEVSNVGADQRG